MVDKECARARVVKTERRWKGRERTTSCKKEEGGEKRGLVSKTGMRRLQVLVVIRNLLG